VPDTGARHRCLTPGGADPLARPTLTPPTLTPSTLTPKGADENCQYLIAERMEKAMIAQIRYD
jgi:hypothetical protein